jgi:hypothetical protein
LNEESSIPPKGEASLTQVATLSYEARLKPLWQLSREVLVKMRPLPRRAKALGFLVLTAALATLGATTAPAEAALGVACPSPTSKAFAPWNDFAYYSYAPNGGFESGSSGWSLTGSAKVVSGNSPFYTHGKGERYSLSLPAGSSATSPPMCISLFSSKMRFFAANQGSSSSRLKVQVIYRGGVGGVLSLVTKTLGLSDFGYVTAGRTWQPSPAIGMLSGTLPLLTTSVQFRFLPADSTGAWLMDDVYLDPLMHW